MDYILYLNRILREYGYYGNVQLTPETELFDLGLDSLDVVEVAMRIEEDLRINIPDQDITTIGDMINIIKNENVDQDRLDLASSNASPIEDVDEKLELYRQKIADLKGVTPEKVVISILV